LIHYRKANLPVNADHPPERTYLFLFLVPVLDLPRSTWQPHEVAEHIFKRRSRSDVNQPQKMGTG
jgi:hypothetical protein